MNCKEYLGVIVIEIVASHNDMDEKIRYSGVQKQAYNTHSQYTYSDTDTKNDLAGIMHLRESRVKNILKSSKTFSKNELADVLHIREYNDNDIKSSATVSKNDLSGVLHLQEVTKKPTNIFSNTFKNLTKHIKNPGWHRPGNRAPSGGSWNRL